MDKDYSSTPKQQHTPNTYPTYGYMVPPMAAQPFPNMLPVSSVQHPYQHPQPPIIWVPVNTRLQQHHAYAHQGHPYYAYPPPPPPQPRQTAQMHSAQTPLQPPPAPPTSNHNRVPKRISPAFVGITRTTSTTTSSSSSHQGTRQTGDSDDDDADQDTLTHDTGDVEDLMFLNFGHREPRSITSNTEWMTSSGMETYEEDGEANDATQQHVDDELETQGPLSFADTDDAMDEEYMPQDDSDDDTDDMEQEDTDECQPERTSRGHAQRRRGDTSRLTGPKRMKPSGRRRRRVTAGSGTETGTSSTRARRAKNGDNGAGRKSGVNKTNKLPDGVERKGWKLGHSDDRSHSNKKENTALLNHMHTLANEHRIDNIPDLTTLQARVVVCHGTLLTLVRQIQLALGNIPLSQGDMALCLTLFGRDMDQKACFLAINNAGLAMGVTEAGLKVCWLEEPHDHGDPNYALLHLLMTEMDTLGDTAHPTTWKEHKQTQLWLQEARRPADNDSDPHWTQCDYDHHLITTEVDKWHPESVRTGWSKANHDERGSCTAREFQTLLAHMKARAAKHPRHQHEHEHQALRELINNGDLKSLVRHIILALGNVGVPPVDLAFFVRLLRPHVTYKQVQPAISHTLTRGVTSLSLKITWIDNPKPSDATLHTLLHLLIDRITPHITTRPITVHAVNFLRIPELVLPEPTDKENMAVEDGLPDGVVRSGWTSWRKSERSHSNKKEHTALLNHMHTLANEHPIDDIPDLMTLQARVVVCHGTTTTLVRQIQLALGNIPLSQGDMAFCLTLLGRDMDQKACFLAINNAGLAMGVTEAGLKVCWLEEPHDHGDPNYALLHLLMTEMENLGDRPHPNTWKEQKQTQLWLQKARRPTDNDSDPHWTQCDYDHHLPTTEVEKWHPETVRSGWAAHSLSDERGSCTAREFQTLLAHMKTRAAKYPRHQHSHEHQALHELINNGDLQSLLRHIILALGNVGVPPVDLAFFVRLLRPRLTCRQVAPAISNTLTRGVTSLSLKIAWLHNPKPNDATLHTLLHTLIDRITPHIATRPTTYTLVNAYPIPSFTLPKRKDPSSSSSSSKRQRLE